MGLRRSKVSAAVRALPARLQEGVSSAFPPGSLCSEDWKKWKVLSASYCVLASHPDSFPAR